MKDCLFLYSKFFLLFLSSFYTYILFKVNFQTFILLEKILLFSNLIFPLLMIYREEPGRAVSGEAAPGEQAPTGADWPGFFLSAHVDFEMSFGRCETPRRASRGNGDDQARRGKGYPQGAPDPCL